MMSFSIMSRCHLLMEISAFHTLSVKYEPCVCICHSAVPVFRVSLLMYCETRFSPAVLVICWSPGLYDTLPGEFPAFCSTALDPQKLTMVLAVVTVSGFLL